jgi:hypothetical protein
MALDPITASTTFATLVSLFSDFLNERKEVSSDDYKKFLEWLSENRHDEIKKLLEQNQATVTSIKVILNSQSSVILEKLRQVDNKLCSLLSTDNLFKSLVISIKPYSALSEQAVSFLRQIESAKASRVLQFNMMGELNYIFIDGVGENLEIMEPRFITDDLEQLLELGLLRLEHNSKGESIYVYTRLASSLVKEMG